MTDEEFQALWDGTDPGPERVGCMLTTLFVLTVLFWTAVVLWVVVL